MNEITAVISLTIRHSYIEFSYTRASKDSTIHNTSIHPLVFQLNTGLGELRHMFHATPVGNHLKVTGQHLAISHPDNTVGADEASYCAH